MSCWSGCPAFWLRPSDIGEDGGVRVRALGTFEVEGVSFRDLGSRKGRTLLKMLAVAAGHPVSVDRIADVLWGEDQPARPAEQVGVLVSRLRGVLGPERITRSDAGYALVVDWVDFSELRSLVAVAARALAEGRLGVACFSADLASITHRLPDDVARGLWDGVARGLVTSDGFGAIRARVGRARPDSRPRRISRLSRGIGSTATSAGRWSLVPTPECQLDHDELAEAVAEQLLNRWGVVFRSLAVHDSLRLPWRNVQWALRRLEDRGLVRGGRFVSGFSGEQYALPAALEQLSHVRKSPRTGERVIVNATDPLNLVGIVVPGATVPAVRTNHITYVDGVPETELPAARQVGNR